MMMDESFEAVLYTQRWEWHGVSLQMRLEILLVRIPNTLWKSQWSLSTRSFRFTVIVGRKTLVTPLFLQELGGPVHPLEWRVSMDKTLFLQGKMWFKTSWKNTPTPDSLGSSGQDTVSAWQAGSPDVPENYAAYPPGSRGITHYA